MRFLSVCSGIEAASCAWSPLGWQCAAVAEVDAFACAVLAHNYPDVPNLGDITRFKEWPDVGRIDLLVGGTPCQSFSVAGLRKGLDDPRGNLALTFLAIADRLRPRWVVWENVPGVLSIEKGRVFGAFLGGLGQLGYGFAYRVLDAQYYGVPQRRRRVFIVGHLGDWRRAAAVLFEHASLSGNPPPRREEGEDVAHAIAAGAGGSKFGSGRDGQDDFVTGALTSRAGRNGGSANDDIDAGRVVTHSLKAEGSDASEDGTGRGCPIVIQDARGKRDCAQNGIGVKVGGPMYTVDATSRHGVLTFDPTQITHPANHTAPAPGDPAPPLARGAHPTCVAFQTRIARNDRGQPPEVTSASTSCDGGTHADSKSHVVEGCIVRRLTPTECERLQGFPDNWTAIPYRSKSACDGPRYRALGNSFAVPVVRWIGERIALVEEVLCRLASGAAWGEGGA